jgi:hypothetical protein
MPPSDVVKVLTTIHSTLSTQRKPLDLYAEAGTEGTSDVNKSRHGSEDLSHVEDGESGRGPESINDRAEHKTDDSVRVDDDGIIHPVCLTDGHWFSTISQAAFISQNA